MTDTVISVEHLSKRYRLGVIGTGTFRDDLKVWFARARGKPNPLAKIGETDHGNREGDILWALKDVNFTVKQGEALGIIGHNGAGKSTLLKILSRVTTPTEGRVRVKGRIASLLEVGTGFHPELTGRENVYLNGAILGMTRAEVNRKFDEIVDFSGVEQFIDTPVKRYSSGMYVRLAFAVAAHLEPEILIVDEVLAVGDAEFQKKCLGKMGDVASEGRTVLFVSHNMSAITRLCPNSIRLNMGEIADIGTSNQIVNNYLNENFESVSNNSIKSLINQLPNDDAFQFVNIVISQNGKEISGNCENGLPLNIELYYKVMKPAVGLRLFYDLLDSEENLLFRSFHDEQNENIVKTDPNYYLTKTTIPANLLGPFTYYLRFHAGIHNVRSCTGNGIKIKILVQNTGNYNRAYMSDPPRGKLALFIPWSIEVVN